MAECVHASKQTQLNFDGTKTSTLVSLILLILLHLQMNGVLSG